MMRTLMYIIEEVASPDAINVEDVESGFTVLEFGGKWYLAIEINFGFNAMNLRDCKNSLLYPNVVEDDEFST